MAAPHDTTRIHELEARIAELEAKAQTQPAPTTSRRGLLRLAGAAAAGATAMVATRPQLAVAADGDPLLIGETSSTTPTEDDSTVLVYTNGTPPTVPAANSTTAPANLFLVRDDPTGTPTSDPSSSMHAAAVAGYTNRTVPNGVYGLTRVAAGAGVVGVATAAGSAGLRARSDSGPTVLLDPVLTAMPTTGTWPKGALVADTAGRLWYNTTGGTPGTWVNLAQSYRAVSPFRVYDSREPKPMQGRIATGESRTITIKDSRTVIGGDVVTVDALPAGVVAITANVTVVDTVLSGYLTVNPGGDAVVKTATVNWSASDQILNNGVNVTINPDTRQVTVIAGGIEGSSTHFVIDVTGWFI